MDDLEYELDNGEDSRPKFLGTGIPGKVSRDYLFHEDKKKDGDFGKALANKEKQDKLLITKEEVLKARLRKVQENNLEDRMKGFK